MSIEVTLLISVVSVVCAIYFSVKNSKHTDVKDIEERVQENTRINMKLDSINYIVKETKEDISRLRDEMKAHNDRIIKVEESAKQAHHRLDAVEERLNIKEG